MTTTTTTPTFTDEQTALAADLYHRYWGDVFHQRGGHDAHLPDGDHFLWAYEQGLAAQPGWREITYDEITEGMALRVMVPRDGRTITYEGVADHEDSGDWITAKGRYLNTDVSSARIFTPCADGLPRDLRAGEASDLPAGACFQKITTYRMGDRWEQEGDSTYRLLSLPEQPAPDPVLVELIGPENALKIAKAGLVCEPRARQ